MTNEKKIWLCEQYAQKAWTVSLTLAQEAVNAGYFGKGYAVVAEETRRLADSLFEYAAGARFDGNDREFKGVAEFALQTGLLAVNAAIEVMHVEKTSGNIDRLLICVEDIRNISLGLKALVGTDVSAPMPEVTSPAYASPYVMPEITAPIKSSRKTDWFLRFSIGGVTMVENMSNMQEICYLRKSDMTGDMFNLRGLTVPLIDCGPSVSQNNRQTVMMINPEGAKLGSRDGIYAVPVDDLDVNTFFLSRIGYNVPPNEDHPFAAYARECWDVAGGDQLVFLDWAKLIVR